MRIRLPKRIEKALAGLIYDQLRYRKTYREIWESGESRNFCSELRWRFQEFNRVQSSVLKIMDDFIYHLKKSLPPDIEVDVPRVGRLRTERLARDRYSNWLAVQGDGEQDWRYFYGSPDQVVDLNEEEGIDAVIQTATFEQYQALARNAEEVVKAFEKALDEQLKVVNKTLDIVSLYADKPLEI